MHACLLQPLHLAVNDMCNFMCQFYFEVLLSLKLGQLFLVGSRVQQHMPTVHCSYFLIWVFKVASGTRHLSGLFCTSQHPTGDFRVQRLSGSLVHCIIHSHCCFYQHCTKPGAPKDTVEASTIQLFPLHSLEVHFTQSKLLLPSTKIRKLMFSCPKFQRMM